MQDQSCRLSWDNLLSAVDMITQSYILPRLLNLNLYQLNCYSSTYYGLTYGFTSKQPRSRHSTLFTAYLILIAYTSNFSTIWSKIVHKHGTCYEFPFVPEY